MVSLRFRSETSPFEAIDTDESSFLSQRLSSEAYRPDMRVQLWSMTCVYHCLSLIYHYSHAVYLFVHCRIQSLI